MSFFNVIYTEFTEIWSKLRAFSEVSFQNVSRKMFLTMYNMNSNTMMNARARTNLRSRLNETTNSPFQGYSNESAMKSHDYQTLTSVSDDNHRSFLTFAVNDIFHTDKHGKKCLTPAFIKALEKYPEQCQQKLNDIYKKQRGPKPACIRQYLKPVVKPETKPRGWNLVNFWDTEKGLQKREVLS